MFRFRRQVYLDNHATTSVARNVRQKMNAVLADCFGNPSSPYRLARNAANVLDESRQIIGRAIGALPEEIIFTGSASEANNQVLKSFLSGVGHRRTKIVSTPIEHSSVMMALAHVQQEGLDVVFCPVHGDGRLDFNTLESLVDENTALVCCMLANNEIGVIQNVARVAQIAHAQGALVMADCVQALGKMAVDVQALDIDYATFSAHKIHGPKGVGALYAKSGSLLRPLIHGGHQENGLRAGTEGLHNIAGFAEACRNIPDMLTKAGAVAQLRDRFVREVAALQPGIHSHSTAVDCLPNTASMTFPGFDNAELLAYLDYHGIGASAGSACNTEDNAPSHVLTAIGMTAEQARQTLRFSLSTQIRPRDMRYTVAVLGDYLQRRNLPVSMVSPAQLDENLLFSENLFIIDIRYGYDRKILKGLPNSRETSKKALRSALHVIPRGKSVLIVCQSGTDGPIMAYFLRSKGIKDVGFVMGGVLAWKIFQPVLYKKLGGVNVTPLEQNSKKS
jgi:cysteine desulfurase